MDCYLQENEWAQREEEASVAQIPTLSALAEKGSEWTHQTAAAFGLTPGLSSASRLRDQC